MKKAKHILLLIIMLISLSACEGSDGDEEPTAAISMDDIQTAVVITLTAEAANFSPTPEPTQTQAPTNTMLPTQTPMSTSTLVTMNQVVVSSGSSTANGCYDAAYVSDVTIPDGTEFAPGESFTKTWSLSNTGTCDWDDDFELVFVSGSDMDGEDTEIGDTVYVGYSESISVDMVAPSSEGTYYGYWRMADESGNLFGGTIYVMIVVTDDASTVTPTPTATDEDDETSTPTSTSASTSTTVASTSTPIPSTSTFTATTVPTTAFTATTAPTADTSSADDESDGE